MKTIFKFTALAVAMGLASCASNSTNAVKTTQVSTTAQVTALSDNAVYSKPRSLNNFDDYVQFLKGKAAGQGVSLQTLNAQGNIRYIESAVRLDQKQAGNAERRKNQPPAAPNPNGATNYINKHLNQAKVDKAVHKYWDIRAQLEKASRTYGVQQEFILALWGMESSFGYYQGNYDVLSVLATLAFDGRRETLFSKEFINAMKMLARNDIDRSRLLGSWAGAMGQTQFMPSSYLSYAADGDNDGKKDIWTNPYDVFASIANYLHTVGWDNSLPWGVEVDLTQYIDLSQSGIEKNKAKSFSQWQAQGVVLKNVNDQQKWNALPDADLWLVRPDKDVGRAFLVTNNFRTIWDWNHSQYYVLSVGIFADQIKAELGL